MHNVNSPRPHTPRTGDGTFVPLAPSRISHSVSSDAEEFMKSMDEEIQNSPTEGQGSKTPAELYALAGEWKRRKEEFIQRHPNDRFDIENHFICLATRLCSLHKENHWEESFIDLLLSWPEDRLEIAKGLAAQHADILFRNWNSFHLSEHETSDLFQFFVRNFSSVNTYLYKPPGTSKTAHEVLELAQFWRAKSQEALHFYPAVTQEEIERFQTALRGMFVSLCGYCHEQWEDGFLETLCPREGENLLFAKALAAQYPNVFFNHRERFHLTEREKKEFAIFLIPEYVDTFFQNLDLFHFSNEALDEVIQIAIETKGFPTQPDAFSKLQTVSEELRYRIFQKLCRHWIQKDEMYNEIEHAHLSPEHQRSLALEMCMCARDSVFIRNLNRFQQPDVEQFYQELIHKNPAYFYHYWAEVHLQSDVKERLGNGNPFIDLYKQLVALYRTQDFRLSAIREPLKAILGRLQNLNRSYGIPDFFCRSFSEPSLYSILSLVTSQSSKEEVLELIDLINQHFFSGTPSLLLATYYPLLKKYPDLQKCVLFYQPERDLVSAIPPYPNVVGITTILEEKLGRKGAPSDFAYRACKTTELNATLEGVAHDPHVRRGIILLLMQGSGPGGGYHYSPLAFEKDDRNVMKILSTDSVVTQVPEFSNLIVDTLQRAPFPHELYLIPFSRQTDTRSCFIFSITDLFSILNVWKRDPQASIFSHLEPQGSSGQHPNLFPPHMLRLTQSISRLHARLSERFTTSKQGEVSLAEYVERHSFFFFDPKPDAPTFHRGNLGADQKTGVYYRRILEQFLNNGQILQKLLQGVR